MAASAARLADRSSTATCPMCSAPRRPWASKNGHHLWECRSCGAISCDVEEPARPLYDSLYAVSGADAPRYVIDSLRRVVRGASSFRRTGRWLDIGYGEGLLLTVAAEEGWSPFGIEVSTPVLERGRRRGWVVTDQPTEDDRFVAGGFDVVTLIETLEHVAKPVDVLASAAAWVRPGGLVYLTTPNARSLNRWVLGAAWTVVDPPDHRTLCTGAALRQALRRVGLNPAAIRAHGWNPSEIVARLKGRRSPAPGGGAARNASAQALGEMLAASPARQTVKAAANAALSWLRLGDTLKAWAVREA